MSVDGIDQGVEGGAEALKVRVRKAVRWIGSVRDYYRAGCDRYDTACSDPCIHARRGRAGVELHEVTDLRGLHRDAESAAALLRDLGLTSLSQVSPFRPKRRLYRP